MTSQVEPQVKPHNVKEIVALLSEQFPLCFTLSGEAKPLKVGIFQDLVERLKDNPLLSKTQLRQALRVYTSSWRYLDAVKEGVARIDLDGTAGDLIDAQQAEHARVGTRQSRLVRCLAFVGLATTPGADAVQDSKQAERGHDHARSQHWAHGHLHHGFRNDRDLPSGHPAKGEQQKGNAKRRHARPSSFISRRVRRITRRVR